jgi:hypothetical protein
MTEDIDEKNEVLTRIRDEITRKLNVLAPLIHEVFPEAMFNLIVHTPVPGEDGKVGLMTANISNMQPQQLNTLLAEFLLNQPSFLPESLGNASGIGPDTDPDTAPAPVQETAANDAAAETEKADDATAASEAAIAAESEKTDTEAKKADGE